MPLKTSPQANQRPVFKTVLVWGIPALTACAILALVFNPSFNPEYGEKPATTYYFLGVEDGLYENPANWQPGYPGTFISPKEKVIIQESVSFTGYDLEVAGKLKIGPGAELFSSRNTLRIASTGYVVNDGELKVHQIENEGKLDNSLAAEIDLYEFRAGPKAITRNAQSARFVTLGNIYNEGVFQNYSYCSIGGELDNRATFSQLSNGQLIVQGKPVQP
ncbi:MAG: hypothetical protein AAGI38_06435 [Bacteroidota bacterium]